MTTTTEHLLQVWEVLVPASRGKQHFAYEHHKAWDAKVRAITGGLTIMAAAKGEWVNEADGSLHTDKVIPVRLACREDQIGEIIDITLEHYKQTAVMAYKVSEQVIIKVKGDNQNQ